MITPRKINIEPGNTTLENENHRPKPAIFRFQPFILSGFLKNHSRNSQLPTIPKNKTPKQKQISRNINYMYGMFRLMGCLELHGGRLTWNLKITQLKRKIIFQTIIFRFHVNLPGCILKKTPRKKTTSNPSSGPPSPDQSHLPFQLPGPPGGGYPGGG